MNNDLSRRTIFDRVAEDYDRVRPGYPEELISDIIALSGIKPGGRILEIGCGTGQATVPFAEHGYTLTCLDIGKNLAAIAAGKCRRYPNVHVENVSFEAWETQENAFDLVISATAFHWIPPEIGFPKSAEVLKPSGSLAIITNGVPTPFTGFLNTVQEVYREVVPEWSDPSDGPTTEERIQKTLSFIEEKGMGLFEPARVIQYPWTAKYTAQQYITLLSTYSDHLSLKDDKRTRLFVGIREMIENRFGGTITRDYCTVAFIAKKKQSEPQDRRMSDSQ